jgi:vacuolar iron transporter family protein
MGLGAWLAAATERKHYYVEEEREQREVREMPEAEIEEIYEIFDKYRISRESVTPIVNQLRTDPDMWVKVCGGPSFPSPSN